MPDQQQLAIEEHSAKATWFDSEYQKSEADPYSDCFTYSRHRLDQVLAGIITPAAGARLLDVGCGTGQHMRRYATAGYRIAGVDGSEEMLRLARQNNPEAQLEHSTVERLPFDSGVFDLVLCIEVFRYLPKLDSCIAEMARVTRAGGVCIATAQPYLNANGYWLINRLANKIRPKRMSSLKQYFIWPARLADAFRRFGFRRVEIISVYTGPVNWLERLARGHVKNVLRRWEPIDAALCQYRVTRPFANMVVVHATK